MISQMANDILEEKADTLVRQGIQYSTYPCQGLEP